MILMERTEKSFGAIDGKDIRPDHLATLSIHQINQLHVSTDSGIVALQELFKVSTDRHPLEPFLVIEGDCEQIEGIGLGMKSGTLCILGNVGDSAAKSMAGGTLIISGNARDQLGAGMTDGMIYIVGNCRHQLASPLPGRKSGIRGGDILVAGDVGDRACERMRRGTVFVAGSAGDYLAPQMIAGSLVVMGEIGGKWAGGMKRGSIILGQNFSSEPCASLSEAGEFELSFLPLIWKHVEARQNEALAALHLAIAFAKSATNRSIRETTMPIRIPRTRWVQRQIADMNCNGRGEILVLRRVSSPSYDASQ